MSEHKIQSSQGVPVVKLALVPKMLGPLTRNWIPRAFVVSFKLETDQGLLLEKAAGALKRYDHHVVVANLLTTR